MNQSKSTEPRSEGAQAVRPTQIPRRQSLPSGLVNSVFFYNNHEIRTQTGAYRVQKKLGQGGNGTTFLVTCSDGPYTGILMAMKVFHRIHDERRRSRFAEEIKLYKSLNHPSIIKLFDEGPVQYQGQEFPAAFVEYAPDDLVAHMVASGGGLSRIHSLRLAMNIAAALKYLHGQQRPILHRDIKPANILVIGSTAKLADMGLAKELQPDGHDPEQDDAQHGLGPYIAMPRFYRTPELVELARSKPVEITASSDVFQFGCVFYEMLTGFNPQRRPRVGPDAMLSDIELDVRSIRGDQGERLNDLVRDMLLIDPAARPTAQHVLSELVRIHRDHAAAITALTGDDT